MLPDAPLDLKIEPLERIEDLERLQSEWIGLWRSCPHATPFQLPQWLIPWWRNLGSGSLRGCAVKCEGRLVALAPCFVVNRTLYLVGTSNSDILDVLIAPEHEAASMNALLDFFADSAGEWDGCEFHQLPPESPLLLVSPPWLTGCQVCTEEQSPFIRLPANCASLAAAVPPGIYRKSRYYRRRAGQEGEFTVDSARPENLDEFIDALFRLHGERWSARGENGMLSQERIRAFHRETIPAMLAARMLRLIGLRIDGQIIAIYYGFSDGRRAYAYFGGFDPRFELIGPGTILIGEAIEDAVRDCLLEFDFLRGQEPYKYKWGARDRPHYILCWQKKK